MPMGKNRFLLFLLAAALACSFSQASIARMENIFMTPELSSSGLPQNVVDELAKVYSDAFDRVSKIVRKPWGTTQSSKEWKQARAATLAFQIDRIMVDLKVSVSHFVGKNFSKPFVEGIQRAQTQARDVKIDAPPLSIAGAFALIDQKSLEVLARDTVSDLTQRSAEKTATQAKMILRRTAQADLSEAEINRVISKGIIFGTPADAIRDLRDQLRAVTDGKVRINGREYDAGDYARTVIRTKTRQATVTARHDRLQELGLDLVSIVGMVSKNFCTAYLGQVYSLSGRSKKYPSIRELPGYGDYGAVPPFHPNCSKSTRPFVEELASDKQLDMAEGDDDQSKMLGIDSSEAQRLFKDLQLYGVVKKRYATTAKELFN